MHGSCCEVGHIKLHQPSLIELWLSSLLATMATTTFRMGVGFGRRPSIIRARNTYVYICSLVANSQSASSRCARKYTQGWSTCQVSCLSASEVALCNKAEGEDFALTGKERVQGIVEANDSETGGFTDGADSEAHVGDVAAKAVEFSQLHAPLSIDSPWRDPAAPICAHT